MKDIKTDFIKLAVQETTPKHILEKIYNNYPKTHSLLANNPNAPKHLFNELKKSNNLDIIKNMASNPSVPKDILIEFLETTPNLLIYELAENKTVYKEVYSKLIKDCKQDLICKIAKNPNTSEELIELLAKIDNIEVQKAIADNYSTKSKTLLEIYNKNLNNVDFALKLVNNPNCPLNIVKKIAVTVEDEKVLLTILKNYNLESKIALKLFKKLSDIYQVEILQTTDNVDIIKLGLNSEYPLVVETALENKHINYSEIEKFLKTKAKEDSNIILAKNPNTPTHILEELLTLNIENINLLLAKNPNTPVHILKELSKNKNYSIRMEVANNVFTPLDILENLYMDEYWIVRLSAIKNPNANYKLIEKALSDPFHEVVKEAKRIAY